MSGEITQIVNGYPKDAFWQLPFVGAEGYHSKTLAYSIWHVFRIEDIVLHTLILNDTQVLESGGWQKKIGAEIITTGNELTGQQHVLHMGLIPEELVYLDLKL